MTKARARRYAYIWLGWTAAGLFYFTQDYSARLYRNDPAPLAPLFEGWMVAMYICAALTPAVLAAGERWPIERRRWPARVALHLLFAAMFSVTEILLETPLLLTMNAIRSLPPTARFRDAFPLLLAYGFMETFCDT